MTTKNNIGCRLKINYDYPELDLLKNFEGMTTGNVCDANGRAGAIDYRIKPIDPSWSFVGAAITVHARPIDNLILYKALAIAKPGNVLVISNDANLSCSVLGDHVCAIAQSLGIAAIVTDGLVRDAGGIREVGLPVFARGVNPNGPFKDGPGEINFPISCGGVPVHPGDILVGDEDGVVVVRHEDLITVVENLRKVSLKEKEMGEKIEAGNLIPKWLDEVLSQKNFQVIE